MTKHSSQDAAQPNGAGRYANFRRHTHLSVIHRFVAALLGGYAFTWGFAALGVVVLVALGGDYHEAEKTLLLLAFLVFLPLFLWAFAAARLVRVWAVLGGGAVFMTAVAWWLQQSILT